MAASAALCAPADDAPASFPFARAVLSGLGQRRKSVPCTWLYDEAGSELFERITRLDAYYPTRTEIQLLERSAAEIAEDIGPGATLVEFGSGSSRKTPILLRALRQPAGYVAIDISGPFVEASLAALRQTLPGLPMRAVVGDFTDPDALPFHPDELPRPRLGFFPGSTIGNFMPDEAVALLARFGRWLGPGATLVVGADATTDPAVLLPAYDDPEGVTAAFNRNLLVRINRELGGTFDVDAFRHEARWLPEQQRIEMHLVSRCVQSVRVLDRTFAFAAGESIHTENSHKVGLIRFRALAARAGWAERQCWMDAKGRFALHVLERVGRRSET